MSGPIGRPGENCQACGQPTGWAIHPGCGAWRRDRLATGWWTRRGREGSNSSVVSKSGS